MTHKFKPGDMVVCAPKNDPLFSSAYPANTTMAVPIAIRTDKGFVAIVDSLIWRGILSDRRMYVEIPEDSPYGLVICYEHDDYVPLDGDEPSFRHYRVFVMISVNGEPEYVRVLESDMVKLTHG